MVVSLSKHFNPTFIPTFLNAVNVDDSLIIKLHSVTVLSDLEFIKVSNAIKAAFPTIHSFTPHPSAGKAREEQRLSSAKANDDL